MLMMASTIGVCVVIIWCQAVEIIKLRKRLEEIENGGHHGTTTENMLRKTN